MFHFTNRPIHTSKTETGNVLFTVFILIKIQTNLKYLLLNVVVRSVAAVGL